MSAGTCVFCGCTEERACVEGCGWTDATRTTCTVCARAEMTAMMLLGVLRHVTATALPRGLVDTWEHLPATTRQRVVMTVRATIENVLEDLDDGVAAIGELSKLADFLLERFPERCELSPEVEQSPVDLAIELLAPLEQRPLIVVP